MRGEGVAGKSELWDWQESLSFFGPFRGLARIVLVTVGLDRSNA